MSGPGLPAPSSLEVTVNELFAPPDLDWRPLDPAHRTLQRLGVLISWPIPFLAAAITLFLTLDQWWWAAIVLTVGLALTVFRFVAQSELYRSWGYAERADDLYITHGVFFRSMTVVPYGRMQVIEVESGPLERAFKLATVKLVTASATTDATIPGLAPAEANRLRDRLSELGESRSSGL